MLLLIRVSVKFWPEEDIASAMTLRSLSPKCYNYMRDVRGFPLPSVSTLNDRAKKFDCEPGLLSSVLALMKSKADTLTPAEKLTVLSFEEMGLAKQWSYDKATDTLYKPHKNVQVVKLRGLASKWKQPIYFAFDESNMQKILLHLIKSVESAGYPVVALVHDLGPCNMRVQ